MKKQVFFDLENIESKTQLIKSLHEPLNLQIHEGDSFDNWDAFNDDMCSFNFEFNSHEKPTHVNLVLKNWDKFEKRLPEVAVAFLSILIQNTDPRQRIDGIDFTFQVRLTTSVDDLIQWSGEPLLKTAPDSVSELQLKSLLEKKNGFFAFESALRVFPSTSTEMSHGLDNWNEPSTWKDSYGDLDEYLFFAEDLFGGQFGLKDSKVYYLEPETKEISFFADNIEDWAGRILLKWDTLLGFSLGHKWQEENGPLDPKKRLIPTQLFFMGGEYKTENLKATDSLESMRYRADIYQQTKHLPDGSQVELRIVP